MGSRNGTSNSAISARGRRALGASPGLSNCTLLLQRGDVCPRVAVFQQHFLGVLTQLRRALSDAGGRGAELDGAAQNFDLLTAAMRNPGEGAQRARLGVVHHLVDA